jgi:hypothetical protein
MLIESFFGLFVVHHSLHLRLSCTSGLVAWFCCNTPCSMVSECCTTRAPQRTAAYNCRGDAFCHIPACCCCHCLLFRCAAKTGWSHLRTTSVFMLADSAMLSHCSGKSPCRREPAWPLIQATPLLFIVVVRLVVLSTLAGSLPGYLCTTRFRSIPQHTTVQLTVCHHPACCLLLLLLLPLSAAQVCRKDWMESFAHICNLRGTMVH